MKARTLRLAPVVVGLAAGALLAGCAVPPRIEGAPCPCPDDFFCDEVRMICVSGKPNIDPPVTTLPNLAATPPVCADIGPAPPVRLTATEYRFAVADLVGVTLSERELPPEDDGSTGFATGADRTNIEAGLAGLAPMVAARARLDRPPICAGVDDLACGPLYVTALGERAFRRPLAPGEKASLTNAFSAAHASGGLTRGLGAVVEGVLGAEAFLRRRDLAGAARPGGTLQVLDAYSIAGRLAQLLWRSVPDDTLLAAAHAGALTHAEEIARQADRMLKDPRAERMLVAFFRDWLDVAPERLMRSPMDLPSYSQDVQASVLRSFDGFAALTVHRDDAPFSALFSSPQVWADGALASFYGLNAPATGDFAPVTPAGAQVRRGLLTAPAFLASTSGELLTHPVRRGTAVMQKFLCGTIPAPPPAAANFQPDNAYGSLRMRLERHRASPTCAGCHRTIDPLGLGLENYDSVGRWRTSDDSFPIDPSGMIPASEGTPALDFNGPAELGDALARSEHAGRCFVRQWFRYAFGRSELEVAADACTLRALDEAFEGGGRRTGALLRRLATVDAITSVRAGAARDVK